MRSDDGCITGMHTLRNWTTSRQCIYSPDAYRGHARAFLKDLEVARPSAIIDIIHPGEAFEVKDEVRAMQKTQRM